MVSVQSKNRNFAFYIHFNKENVISGHFGDSHTHINLIGMLKIDTQVPKYMRNTRFERID